MPLVWAHAEHVKLLRSLKDGRVFDMPPEPVQRYQGQGVAANFEVWRFDRRRRTVAGKNLRIEVLELARIHWSSDGWHTTYDDPTQDTGLGVHIFDLPAATLAPGTTIVFTLFWPQHQCWEGTDFAVEVVGRNEPPLATSTTDIFGSASTPSHANQNRGSDFRLALR